MTVLISSRLNSSFDKSKFGDDITLSDKALNYLNAEPIKLDEWVKGDLANGNISRSEYFTNPVLEYIDGMSSNVNIIIQICTNNPETNFPLAVNEVYNLANSSANLIIQLQQFLNHTNRISGATDADSNDENEGLKPTYQSCISVGGILTTVIGPADKIKDSSLILNNFTSLYINDELDSNNRSIGNSTIFLSGADDATEPSAINFIKDKIDIANNLLYIRRTYDENHFLESQRILNDYQFLNSLQNSGSTERNLIKNVIGTQKLRNIASNVSTTS